MIEYLLWVRQAVEQDFNGASGASIPPLGIKRCETNDGIVSEMQLNVGLADT
jgi:hypothetical protein